MSRIVPGSFRLAAAVLALTALAILGSTTSQARAASADYTKGYDLGLEAWKYGLPVVKMDQTFRIQTSVNVPDGRGRGPVNRFSHVRVLADASARDVVAPNNDTPYSIAWLDLRRQPMVIHIPKVNRYFVIPLYDPYTEDFRNLGTVAKTKPGDYVVTGPGQHGVKIPKGTHRIKSRYDRVWIIGRTINFGPADLKQHPQHPEPVQDHAAEPLRHPLPATQAEASGHDPQRRADAGRASFLRPARTAAEEVPAAQGRPGGVREACRDRGRPRQAALGRLLTERRHQAGDDRRGRRRAGRASDRGHRPIPDRGAEAQRLAGPADRPLRDRLRLSGSDHPGRPGCADPLRGHLPRRPDRQLPRSR